MTSTKAPAAGDGVLHPMALLSLLFLILNDHVLKERFHNAITGKLSDFAGLVFFPLLVVALLELLQAATRRYRGPSGRMLLMVVVTVGVCFALMKTWGPAADAYRLAMSLLQWPFFAIRAGVSGAPLPALRGVRHLVDPTDLMALPSLALAWWIGHGRAASTRAHPTR